MTLQPALEMRQRLGAEPIAVDSRELPHEWHDRSVGQPANRSAKLAGSGQARVNFVQENKATLAEGAGIGAMALRILVAVEVAFERTVVLRDQLRVVARKPVFRIPVCQGPAHDVEAFVQHRSVRQDQHGHGALWRSGQHLPGALPKAGLRAVRRACR